MDITITCKSYEELAQLAKTLLSGPEPPAQGGMHAAPVTPDVPVSPTAPVTPAAPMGQAATQMPPAAPAVPMAPAAPQTPPAQNAAVPTSTAGYTRDDLAKAAVTLMDSGRQAELKQQLLQGFGVASLPELPAERYGEFATVLRTMGAPI